MKVGPKGAVRLLGCLYMFMCSFFLLLEKGFPGAAAAEWADGEQWLTPSSWTISLLWAIWGCPGSRKVPIVTEMFWICEALSWIYFKVFP